MKCEALRPLLHRFLDGELPPRRVPDVQRHLAGCTACARELDELRSLREALQMLTPVYFPPPGLGPRIQEALRHYQPPTPGPRVPGRTILVAAAALLLAGAVTWGLSANWGRSHGRGLPQGPVPPWPNGGPSALGPDANTAVALHPCLQSRLADLPSLPELAADGYVLAGGRIDSSGSAQAALLLFRRGPNVVTLTMRPVGMDNPAGGVELREEKGRRLARWAQSGMACLAVSDLDRPATERFVSLVRHSNLVGAIAAQPGGK